MLELKGKYTDCKIFTDNCEQEAISQVYQFLNHEAFADCRVRFMPDIHAGAGAVIGTTVEMSDKIIPNVIGVDIGCGMLSYKLDTNNIDFEALDGFIHSEIPSGFNINKKKQAIGDALEKDIRNVCVDLKINIDRVLKSVGSLGGGNHFIELGKDEEGSLWLTVHSGSRNFGLQIAKHHQKIAEAYSLASITDEQLKIEIDRIKRTFTGKKIQTEIEKLKSRAKVRKHKRNGLEYLEGSTSNDYINHMKVAQRYAIRSREIMLDRIVAFLNVSVLEKIESTHNYINFDDGIIRKGAISAHEGELVVIPWNMRDGLIIGEGLGNPDWNYSAPHGAGRIMSRSKAKANIDLEEFEDSMKDVYSTCVSESTLDESPMAYKDHNEVEMYLSETVKILHRVKPLYNFKA